MCSMSRCHLSHDQCRSARPKRGCFWPNCRVLWVTVTDRNAVDSTVGTEYSSTAGDATRSIHNPPCSPTLPQGRKGLCRVLSRALSPNGPSSRRVGLSYMTTSPRSCSRCDGSTGSVQFLVWSARGPEPNGSLARLDPGDGVVLFTSSRCRGEPDSLDLCHSKRRWRPHRVRSSLRYDGTNPLIPACQADSGGIEGKSGFSASVAPG